MSYLQTDRNKKKILGKDRILAVILGFLFIFLGNIFSDKLISGVIWFKNLVYIGSKNPTNNQDQNLDPQYLSTKVTALESENEALKNMLGANDGLNVTRPRGAIFAVTERPPMTPYDTLTIKGGSDNGIQVGDLAFAGPDTLVGQVSTVFSNSSIVTLYSSSGQQQQVYVGTSSNSIVSEGRGGGNFYIKVPSETKITIGDPVIWPSMQNILIGVVDKVDSNPGDAFSYILFRSLVPIYSIRYVEIVPNNF